MTKKEYNKQLKNKEWASKRLEILERDNYKCIRCGTDDNLEIHHLSYIKGRNAWEYSSGDLITLCHRCHTETHKKNDRDLKEEFCFTFLNPLRDIIGLKSIVDLKVLYVLCNMAEFNTGKVSMSTNRRDEICEILGITYNTLANSISRLKKNNFITDKKRDYTINPAYFWKGDLKTRDQLLKEGGKLTLNIEFENEVTNE